MDSAKITEYAHALVEAHSDRAEFEAAQKAKQAEEAGVSEESANWRAIRKAIAEIRGAHES